MSTEQRESLDAILRNSAFPADSDVNEQRRRLRELASAQPLPADVTVTSAALGGVPTAEVTVAGIEPRHVFLYFHAGVYVLGDAFQSAGLAAQIGRRLPGSSPWTTGSPPTPVPGRGRRCPGRLPSPVVGRRGPGRHRVRR